MSSNMFHIDELRTISRAHPGNFVIPTGRRVTENLLGIPEEMRTQPIIGCYGRMLRNEDYRPTTHSSQGSSTSQQYRGSSRLRQIVTPNPQHMEERPQSLKDILIEYLTETPVHGIKYTVRDMIPFRVIWTAAILTCIVCACYFMAKAWENFFESPILTAVRNAYYPLHKIYFPAVTICPGSNVKKRIGLDILYSTYKDTFIGTDINVTLIHLMRALTFMKFPYYHVMKYELDKIENIAQFDTLNITNFMLEVLPTMDEMFHSCRWQGDAVNCTEIFTLQRYEGGFCYAFNSLTSLKCRRSTHECQKEIRKNAAAGTTTGLEVFVNPRSRDDHLGRDQEAKGVKVMIHDPWELPRLGNGLFVMENKPKVCIIKILASVTTSSETMRILSPMDRNCYFENEQDLKITHEYSQSDCIIECRLKHIMHTCECQPYFFSFPEDPTPECSASKLACLINENKNFKYLQDPTHTGEVINGTYCYPCLPSCNSINYEVNAIFTEDSKPINESSIGYLNIYYREQSAVEYYRVFAIDKMQLLVSVGGIAGLFLGCSLLSVFELLFCLCKCILVLMKNVLCMKSTIQPEDSPKDENVKTTSENNEDDSNNAE